MSSSNNLVSQERKGFSLTPQNLEQAMQLAEIMASSEIVPKVYQGKPGNVLIAVQMGADLGFSPTQALQSIAVINGNPAVWGDGMRALIMSSPDLEDMREWYDEKSATAYCEIKRKMKGGKITTFVGSFSMAQAQQAKLAGKLPWQQYPERMLQWRAFGFAARDAFADRLKGIKLAEEVQDYPEEKHIGSSSTAEAHRVDPKMIHSSIQNKPKKEDLQQEELVQESKADEVIDDGGECFNSIFNWLESIEDMDKLKAAGKVIEEEKEAGNLTSDEVNRLRIKYVEVRIKIKESSPE